ncbi:MAG: hypothetical protein AAFQ87_25580, partial [Bacteroidota bacterium]
MLLILFPQQAVAHSNFKLISLAQAVDEIANKYLVSIIYDVEQLQSVEIGPWQIVQGNAEDNLKQVLKHTGFAYQKLNASTFVIKPNRSAKRSPNTSPSPQKQSILQEIQGRVVDGETKEGLTGVGIRVKENNTGRLSEEDGRFSIEAKIG